jgi:hypothetical protein
MQTTVRCASPLHLTRENGGEARLVVEGEGEREKEPLPRQSHEYIGARRPPTQVSGDAGWGGMQVLLLQT